MNMQQLMQTCIKKGASDIHLRVGRKPCLRLHGRMRDLQGEPLTPQETHQLIHEILPERLEADLEVKGTADFGHAFGEEARFRVSAFKEKGNLGAALRLIPNKLLSFEEIGLPDHIKDLGETTVSIKLHPEVRAEIKVTVVKES